MSAMKVVTSSRKSLMLGMSHDLVFLFSVNSRRMKHMFKAFQNSPTSSLCESKVSRSCLKVKKKVNDNSCNEKKKGLNKRYEVLEPKKLENDIGDEQHIQVVAKDSPCLVEPFLFV